MKLWFVLRRLLPALAIVGLILAPLARPADARPPAPAAMASDMPCCPDERMPAPDCVKSCPLMAVCMAKCFQGTPTAGGTAGALLAAARLSADYADINRDGLAQAPPARPPRG